MSFNFGLAKEIYGLNPWCVDLKSLPYLTSILNNIQKGVSLEIPEQKYNSISLYDISSKETRFITNTWQLESDNDFDGIGVINLNGPITKGGGTSSNGTKDISNQMLRMANDNRVKGFVLKVDSGGGASNAVSLLSDTINEINKTKPVYTLVEKGGVMASAAYGIGSAGRKIYAEDKMSTIGSVGTMISFEGKKANTTDKNGVKNIVLYATKSTMKNKAFEEALNNDNYELLVNELLDPINESFIDLVVSNRPQLAGTKFDDGHTVFSKDAIGTFIDGIASFDEVVQMVLTDSKLNLSNNNQNSIKMTKGELQSSHLEVYNEIVSEGVSAERERVSAWMVHAKTDMDAVVLGIEGGKAIDSVSTQKFLVKQANLGNFEALKNDSQKPVTTEAAEGLSADAKNEDKELESAFEFELKK